MFSEPIATDLQFESKEERYAFCISAIQGVLEGESDLTANLANTAAILKEYFGWWWIGFYMVNNGQLVLGPFQGPVACTRIDLGKGVCGSAWKQKQTLVVADVHRFPGHIACSAASNSEIVVPITKGAKVVAVLDADSEYLSHFDQTDAENLERIASILSAYFP